MSLSKILCLSFCNKFFFFVYRLTLIVSTARVGASTSALATGRIRMTVARKSILSGSALPFPTPTMSSSHAHSHIASLPALWLASAFMIVLGILNMGLFLFSFRKIDTLLCYVSNQMSFWCFLLLLASWQPPARSTLRALFAHIMKARL